MSRYHPLEQHLSSLTVDRWCANFVEIEEIIDGELPSSARRYPAWWANQKGGGHTQTSGWLDAGWETSALDLGGEKVTFTRAKRFVAPPKVAKSINHNDQLQERPGVEVRKRGLSIAEAKGELAIHYDVPTDRIDITIRG